MASPHIDPAPNDPESPDDSFARLWPRPRIIEREEAEPFSFHGTARIAAGPAGLEALWQRARALFASPRASSEAAQGPAISARIDAGISREDYVLGVAADKVTIEAGSERGLFRALTTLAQLRHIAMLESPDALVAPGRVEDGPCFPRRGFQLDISRNRVPTLEGLKAWVDTLARWKLDQLQLYTEHTFAYRDHAEVWKDASPLTADEIRELDQYAAERFVELVPNQQSFGHLHRWLRLERYKPLAECPDGVEHPFANEREPFSICPTDPASLGFLGKLYDELLPNFASSQFNAGLDETFDLGEGRSADACGERGKGAVYLDFLNSVHGLLQERGKRMQFWADIALNYPELLDRLPLDSLPLIWGYEADHPFADQCSAIGRHGHEFYVCPGTSSWQSFGGRVDNARANLLNAARTGEAEGAIGYLITDWGDRGHHQPPSISRFGLWFGAGCSWSGADALDSPSAAPFDIARELSRHAYDDAGGATGRAVVALGEAGRLCEDGASNGTGLFFLLSFHDQGVPHERFPTLTRAGLDRAAAHLQATARELDRAHPGGPDGSLVRDELTWVKDMLAFACRFGRARLEAPDGSPLSALPSQVRREFAGELRELTDRHRANWIARDRPGGLEESTGWLERVTAALESK